MAPKTRPASKVINAADGLGSVEGMKARPIRSVLRHLDTVAVSAAARLETRNREVHLPPVSTYRWWARRAESVFGAIIDAVTTDRPGRLLVADLFAGGGVIPLAAVIRGHRVYAQDLNPWAVTGIVGMLGPPDPAALRRAAAAFAELAAPLVQRAYSTRFASGEPATIAHTFRVATAACTSCNTRARLFPHALVTLLARAEGGCREAFLACPAGHLFVGECDHGARCPRCRRLTDPAATYAPRRIVTCLACKHRESLETRVKHGAWRWEVVLVERVGEGKREFATPTPTEIDQAEGPQWRPSVALDKIPIGQETKVLTRHGFATWSDLYPRRQLIIMKKLLALFKQVDKDESVRRALRLAVLGAAEMAGYASRWDRWYLKSYEAMANHRFNFTTFVVEPNVWGTATRGRGTVLRRLRLIEKAATWLGDRCGRLRVQGPLPAARPRTTMPTTVNARVVEGSSERVVLPDACVDIVLTDPPYHDDVQYDELSLPLRAWADLTTGPLMGEAVVNGTKAHTTNDGAYRHLLQRIFCEARRILRTDGHLIFSYANREPGAWINLFEALQGAGFWPVGYAIVHSENETNHAKRRVSGCSLDLLMDLVPQGNRVVRPWTPPLEGRSAEEDYLHLAGRTFMRIRTLGGEWDATFAAELRGSRFLKRR